MTRRAADATGDGTAASRAVWPDTGPAYVKVGRGRVRWLRPTLNRLTTGGSKGARHSVQMDFVVHEDGHLVVYSAAVPQDVLFAWLHQSGLLHRKIQPPEPPAARPRRNTTSHDHAHQPAQVRRQ